MTRTNPKTCRICAFCEHWYDPANSHIYPCKPYNGEHWEYDEKASAPCFKRMTDTISSKTCADYKPKKLM